MTIRKSNKNDNRRVSFKNANVGTNNPSSIQLKLRKKYVAQGLRSAIEEDDERMVDFDPHKTSTFRRRNSPIPGSARNNKAKGLVENGAGWYQVTVSVKFSTLYNFFITSILKCFCACFCSAIASIWAKMR